jgi:hypothetical protein
MAHIALGLGTVLLRLRAARWGRAILPLPGGAFDVLNTALTWLVGTWSSRTAVGRSFDRRYATALRLLDGVHDDEWDRVSHVAIQRLTVEEVFRYQVDHIHGHLAAVRAVLPDRAAGTGDQASGA